MVSLTCCKEQRKPLVIFFYHFLAILARTVGEHKRGEARHVLVLWIGDDQASESGSRTDGGSA